MLKFSSLTAMALVMSVTAATADGLSLKDAPPAMSWGGLYFGGTVGYGWGSSESWYRYPSGGDNQHPLTSNDPSGALAGVTVGYNYQLNKKWVLGVEGDLSMADISGEDGKVLWNWDPGNGADPNGHHRWYSGWGSLFTLRARAGYDLNGILVYGTLGYAAVHSDEYILGDNANQTTDNRGWRSGWVAGFGAEKMFTDRLSGKIEYLHVGMGEKTGYSNEDRPYAFSNDLDIIRLGVNYKIH